MLASLVVLALLASVPLNAYAEDGAEDLTAPSTTDIGNPPTTAGSGT